eukprot:TRINITY_DN724_c0_g1_i1.p1 TRINITY_DN724_c0_g1~~TRINITY_DN724_c0_g1_i1.p1  ORF type:complete len:357 (+),score=79.40 TRINITY_DN724_c0_g1_i1:109-1179(+)
MNETEEPCKCVFQVLYGFLKGTSSPSIPQTAADDRSAVRPKSKEAQSLLVGDFLSNIVKVPQEELKGCDDSLLASILRPPLFTGIGLLSRFLVGWMHPLHVSGDISTLHSIWDTQQGGGGDTRSRGLLTVSNHVTAVDDPVIVSVLCPLSMHWANAGRAMRWSLCADNRCFCFGPLVDGLMRVLNVLPVWRGRGVHQSGLDEAIQRLSGPPPGNWVHYFPEGTRTKNGKMGRFRSGGLGRMLMSADPPPLVVPIFHQGMETVFRAGLQGICCSRTPVNVHIGSPMDFSKTIHRWKRAQLISQKFTRLLSKSLARRSDLYFNRKCSLSLAKKVQRRMDELEKGSNMYHLNTKIAERS